MAELFLWQHWKAMKTSSSFILKEAEQQISVTGGDAAAPLCTCIWYLKEKEKAAAPAKANTCVELKSIQSKSN